MIVLPVKIAFFEETYLLWEIFDYFMDLCFVLEIILNFFTSYYDAKEHLVFSMKEIACNYLMFWFWVDLVSVIPFGLLF